MGKCWKWGESLAENREALDTRRGQLVTSVAELIGRSAELIQKYQPQGVVNRSGYHLSDVPGDISITMVKGPTPPGTGVKAPATARTSSGCTSPTSTEPRFCNVARGAGYRERSCALPLPWSGG